MMSWKNTRSFRPAVWLQIGLLLCFTIFLIVGAGPALMPLSLILVTVSCLVCWMGLLSIRSQDSSGYPPVSVFFILFLFFFYVLRGWSFFFLEDEGLMIGLGVADPKSEAMRVIAWIGIFLSFLTLGYAFAERTGYLRRRIWNMCEFVFMRQGRKRMDSVLVGWYSAVVATFGLVAVFLISLVASNYNADEQLMGGFSGYLVALPFVFYGMNVLGWQLTISKGLKFNSADSPFALFQAAGICVILVATVYFARQISTFRIYYLSPIAMIALSLIPRRISFWVFAAGCVLVFPILVTLGNTRNTENIGDVFTDIGAITQERHQQGGAAAILLAPFSSQGGDFTCLDVFASALANEQRFRPWGLSYLYVFAHPIPRKFWPSKPIEGMLVDRESFLTAREFGQEARGIPFTPGIVGDLYLEGGYLFIILGAVVIGFFLNQLDHVLVIGRTLLADARLASTSAIFVFLAFFAIRSTPYQLVYYAVFISAGHFLSARVYPGESTVLRPSPPANKWNPYGR